MRWIIPLLLCAQVVSATQINLLRGLGGITTGNVYNNTRGYSFTTKINPLKVTRLGIRGFDPAGGFGWYESGYGSVGIWREDGTLVASHVPPFQTVEEGYYWATLPEPIVLEPYTTYRIANRGFTFERTLEKQAFSAGSSAVVVNGIVHSSEQSFAFPSSGPYSDVERWPTVYTMHVGPNFTFEILPYDTTPPVITLNGANPQTIYRGTAFIDLGATVTDDFDVTRTITGSGSVDATTVGSYTLAYSAQDEVGNVATPVTRTVEVVLDPNGDEDNDGLNNTEEANLGTNPYLRDTDSDGVNDLREVGDGTDPLDPASFESASKGLMAYFPLDGSSHDFSGNQRHTTVTGSAEYVADRFGVNGAALSFNDAAVPLQALGAGLPLSGSSFTVSLWFSKATDPVDAWIFRIGSESASGKAISLALDYPGDVRFSFFFNDLDYYSSPPQATNEWYHIVGTHDATSGVRKLYIDGVQVGSDVPPEGFSGDDIFSFGHRGTTMDDISIYNRALSGPEVVSLHASEKYNGFGLEGAATKSPFDPATAVNWSSGGAAWTVDTSVAHDDVDSVKAQTTDGQSTYREYTVTGPAVVDFWWKVSSEELYDTFSWSVNGVNQQTISGEVDWTYRTLTLPAGTHTIRWTYTKDESGAVGQDAGWLDDFAVYPATASLQVRDGATVLDDEATVDFGSADTGSTGFTKSLTFANEGYVPLEVQLSLPEGSPFAFDDGAATYELLLGRGEIVDVPIVLSTARAGTMTEKLQLQLPGIPALPGKQPTSVTLTGYVRGPDIGLTQGATALASGQTFDMGLAPRTVEFTIRNNGNVGDLVIAGISATGNFQITQQPATTIPPQTSTTFKVLAQNVVNLLQAGSVSITSNAGNLETFSLTLTSKSLISVEGIADGSMATSGTGGATAWDFAATTLPSGQSGQALKTGTTPNNGGSVLEFTTQTAGVVSWSWKVTTQENFDWLLFEVDGQEAAGISTKNGAWQTQVVQVPAGANVRWVYRKDASGTIGEDAGYLADVEFRSLAANQPFSQWGQTQNVTDPLQRMPKSGMQAMFGWLGGFGVDGENTDDIHHSWIIIEGRLTYRYPISKTADGTQQLLYSSDMSSWTTRRISQRIVSEDADRMVIEATAPGGTKGFFKVVGGGDTSGIMVRVQGGTLPSSSQLTGQTLANFFIGKTEVTWDEWQDVQDWSSANGYDLTDVGAGSSPRSPVTFVNYYDIKKWCNAKSEKHGLVPVYKVNGKIYKTGQSEPTVDSSADGYRLPQEVEWEWAARGGVSSQGFVYSGSNDVNTVAWYVSNSGNRTKLVGTKVANELGLHDMSGNVWEACEGFYPNFSTQLQKGGSFLDTPTSTYLTVKFRGALNPDLRLRNCGFRVAQNGED